MSPANEFKELPAMKLDALDATIPPEYWGWWFILVDKGNMDKINLIVPYNLGIALRAINDIDLDAALIEAWEIIHNVVKWLKLFLAETKNTPMPKTAGAAQELYGAVQKVYEKLMLIPPKNMTFQELTRLKTLLQNFEREFEHDSREINVFSLPNRCAYSTTTLIDCGENLLPEKVRRAVSDYVINEMHEAGKCIAFNLPTAAGFHLLRAVESVLRQYYDVLSGSKAKTKQKNGRDAAMGTYLNEIEKHGAETKIVSVLRQIKDLHRNPHMHPEEDVLTLLKPSLKAKRVRH